MGAEGIANFDVTFDPETAAEPPEPADKPDKPPEGDEESGAKSVNHAIKGSDDEDKPPPKKQAKPKEDDGDEEESDADDDPKKRTESEPYAKGTAKVKLKDGNETTVDELVKGYMRQSDYSRKRSEDSRNAEEFKRQKETFEVNKRRFEGFWERFVREPEFMLEVLEERAFDTFRAAAILHAEEYARMQSMDPDTRRIHEENKRLTRSQRTEERERKAREAQQQQEQATAHQKEMAKKYNEWVPGAMRDAGLLVDGDDDHNKEAFRMLKGQILSEYGKGDRTQEEIMAAAHAVAESRAFKALMAQKGQLDPEALEKLIGPDMMKKVLKHQAQKLQGQKSQPAAPTEPRTETPKKKPKKQEGPRGAAFLRKLQNDMGI